MKKSWKRTIELITLFFFILTNVFPFAAEGHNTDIGAIIYGIDTWKQMEKHGKDNYNDLLSYYIVSDAVVFAVDYQAIGDKSAEKYDSLQKNIQNTSHSFILPDRLSFITTGGGSHRAYNHQGFYINYVEKQKYLNISEDVAQKREQRWKLGRDEVLIPAVAAAFGLERTDPRAELISVFAYYAHMIGDLAEGEQSSKAQMKDLSTYSGLLTTCINDIRNAASKCFQQSLILQSFYQSAESLSRTITKNNDNSLSYFEVKALLQRYVPLIIRELGVTTEGI